MVKNLSAGKEKKLLRKAETERIQLAKAAAKTASEVSNLLDDYPALQRYKCNGLEAALSFHHSKDMHHELTDWAFKLCKRNMQEMYDATWGWSDKTKLKELTDDNARFIIAVQSSSSSRLGSQAPLAFIHFRFEEEGGVPVLYVYEVQLEDRCQRKGLGRLLMRLAELVAFRCGMQAVMLTVMQANVAALALYTKLGYTRHASSPDLDPDGRPGYLILFKPLGKK